MSTNRVPDELAARRSMSIRWASEPPIGWRLYSPFRVVCRGSLDDITGDAVDQPGRRARKVPPAARIACWRWP